MRPQMDGVCVPSLSETSTVSADLSTRVLEIHQLTLHEASSAARLWENLESRSANVSPS